MTSKRSRWNQILNGESSEFNMMLDVTSFAVVQQLIQLMFRDCFSDSSV